MPKKSRIDAYATKDLVGHITAVEKSLFDLRFRLMHYFKAADKIRERFTGIEKTFEEYASDSKEEVKPRAKENGV